MKKLLFLACLLAGTTFATAKNTEPKTGTEPKTEPKKEATALNTDPKKDECGEEIEPEYWITCSITVTDEETGVSTTLTASANTFFRGEAGALATCNERLQRLIIYDNQ
jgi:hypothetical protein